MLTSSLFSSQNIEALELFSDVRKEEVQQDADKILAIFCDGLMQTGLNKLRASEPREASV